MNPTRILFSIATCVLVSYCAHAGDSDLDPTFGDGGIASTLVGTTGNNPSAMTVQPDGKILISGIARDNQSAGSYGFDVALVRFNRDGTLDTTFSGDGKLATDIGSSHPVYTDDKASAVRAQPDGKIVVAGSTRRYTKTNNSSFEWYMWDLLLLRYEADGSLDTSFGNAGQVIVDINGNGNTPEGFNDVALQSDNKIIGVGYTYPGNNRFLVARFNTDGSLDSGFGSAGTGMVIEHFSANTLEDAYSVAILPDDSLVVVGRGIKPDGNATTSILKLTANGLLDTSFNGSGKIAVSILTSSGANFVTSDAAGRILVAGKAGGGGTAGANDESAMIMRYNPDGSLDTSFNGTGIFTTSYGGDFKYEAMNSLQVQADGKLIAAGTVSYPNQLALLRLNDDGTPSETFAPAGQRILTLDGYSGYGILGTGLDADGKLLAGTYLQSGYDFFFSALRFGGPDFVRRWDDGYADLGDGWQGLPWFGMYMPLDNDWIWHMEQGFIHVEGDGAPDSLYYYCHDKGWLWTCETISPYYYNLTTGTWGP